MRNRISMFRLSLSLLLSFILLISIVFPNTTIAQGNLVESKLISAIKNTSVENKIDSKLIKQFKDQNQITFLLKFEDQVDTSRVAMEATEKAKKEKLTEVSAKLQVRSTVVSTLRNTAMETQTEVMDYLEKAKKKGEVESVQSFYVVNAIAVTATKAVMDKLAAYPEVAKILPNEMRQIIKPIQPKVKTTNLNSSTVEWGVEQVGAPQVWDMGIDGAGIVVASIDTGVQWDHPALMEKYRGYNPENPNQPDHQLNWFDAVDGKEVPYDDLAHGTHTVGTMVGSEPDGSNQIGVAPGAKWIAVKAFSERGGQDVDLLEAGEWILAPKDAEGNPHPELAPDIVNNSWGGGAGLNEWYRPMVQNWRAANILPVFAAGNSGENGLGSIEVPSNYPESFAVGATDSNNKLAYFSSRGPGPYDESKPNVSAPGVNIRSATPGSDYQDGWSGTSMATPHIAGVIALLKQANASLSIDQIEKLLEDTAIPLTDSEYPTSPNYGYGHGFVNAYNAIKTSNNGYGTVKGIVGHDGQDKTNPTYQHTSPDFVYDQVVLPLTVEVQDNISVDTVEIQYLVDQQWKTVKATRTAGDFRNGTYQAVVPGTDISKGTFTYKWKMVDYGQNQVTSPEFNVEVKRAITIGYFQDLEAVPEGWYSEGWNNDWEWGSPVAGPGHAFSGQNAYGTNLDGPHAPNTYSFLNMPPIDLPESGNSYLQYKQWYDFSVEGIGGSVDYGAVLVSTDNKNWEILTKTEPTEFYENGVPKEYTTDDWIDAEVNLSAYAGKRIYIRFNMHAIQVGFPGEEGRQGWYLDDISLTDKPITEDTKQEIFKKNTTNEIHIKKNSKNSVLAPTATFVQNTSSQPDVLPIGAQVTLVDSGYSVTANPADGRFSMFHNSGEFTLRAEAYGFHSKDQAVSIPKDGIVEANFNLKPLGKGTVEGVVKDQTTGKPISDAIISLVEEAAVAPVKTDSKGRFKLTAYEGTYTLHVFKKDYVPNDDSITLQSNKKTKQEVELKRFIGSPGEIAYDDGTSEESWFFPFDANNGIAIRMSLEEGVTKSWLTGGLFKVETEFPDPGSTRFQVAVYDSTGVNGAPGKRIGGPFEATARTDGEWTHVDLADKEIFVTGDFYLVYVQPEAYNPDGGSIPSLQSDLNSPFQDRTWLLGNSTWVHETDPQFGNMMIRAVMNNAISAPVIETP